MPTIPKPNDFCYEKIYRYSLIHLIVYYSYFAFIFVLVVLLTLFTQIPYLIIKFQDA
jgi:hypothetical protein